MHFIQTASIDAKKISFTKSYLKAVRQAACVVILITIGFTSIKPNTVTAQTTAPIDLAVSPPVAYLSAKPGEKSVHSITIVHQGTTPLLVTPKLVDFTTDGSSNQPVLQSETDVQFIELAPPLSWNSSFSLKPKQSKNILLEITPPLEKTNTELHLTVLFETRPDPTTAIVDTDATRVSAMIASNIVLTVQSDGIDRSLLAIAALRTPVIIDSFQGLRFSILAKNSGANAGTASGSASIKDTFGKTVSNFKLFPDTILANSTRLLRTGDNEALDSLSTEFTYKPYFLLGMYTIDVQLNQEKFDYSTNNVFLSKKIVALPISLIAMVVGSLLMYQIFVFISERFSQNSLLQTQRDL